MQSGKEEKALGNYCSDYSQPVRCLVIPGTAEMCRKEEMEKKREGEDEHGVKGFPHLRILKCLRPHLE